MPIPLDFKAAMAEAIGCTNDENEKSSSAADLEDEEERLEREHFMKVVYAFLAYRSCSIRKLEKRVKDLANIPLWHRKLVPDYANRLKESKACIDENQKLVALIVNFTDGMFRNMDFGVAGIEHQGSLPMIAPEDQSKVVTTLTQIVRDWAEEGAAERQSSYGPIIKAMETYLPKEDRPNVKVLVPGAGLGRLVYETAKLGFNCQGNEFSLYMLFASNFILNQIQEKNCIVYYPWIHQFCNVFQSDHHTKPVKFPDVEPRGLPPNANLSMAAGDFLEVYTVKDYWDSVLTCFFIDTAHNIIAYVEKIFDILKPGGYWINNGPLLYHFADVPGESSIDLSYEDLRKVITEGFNFEIIEEKTDDRSHYIQNPNSLLGMNYKCIFFVARKPSS